MRTLTLSLATLSLVAALSACGSDDPEPKIAAPTSDPPSSVTSTPPTDPLTSTAPSEPESAEEFIARWQELGIKMQLTGKVSPYLALTDQCHSCVAFADYVKDIYAAGGSIEGGEGSANDIRLVGSKAGVDVYEYTVTFTESEIRESQSADVQTVAGGTSRYQLNLTADGDSWLVARISRVES